MADTRIDRVVPVAPQEDPRRRDVSRLPAATGHVEDNPACDIDWQTASVEQVKQARTTFRAQNPTVDSPGPANLRTLVRYLLGRQALGRILRPDEVNSKSPGIPDLFLFRLSKKKRISDAMFVEVKKPDEHVLPSQHKEIKFLQSIGLQAGIVRLDEQWPWERDGPNENGSETRSEGASATRVRGN